MNDHTIKELGAAIVLQAVKDFVRSKSQKKRQEILKDLRSPWMDMLTNGTSAIVAEQLELHPEEIKARITKGGV